MESRQRSKPEFVSINGPNPIKLFGGHKTSAVIDSLGKVTILPKEFYCMVQPLQQTNLPFFEKAVNVACCDKTVIALCSSGRVYEVSTKSNLANFSLVRDLQGIKIVFISGLYEHFLAVSEDGRVFSRGTNSAGQLGIGNENDLSSFVEISSLRKYKIISAFAGNRFSLFLTSNGQILACGDNNYGNLFLEGSPSYLWPVETTIKNGAKFCIASFSQSAAFIGCEPPSNMPNMPVIESNDINLMNSKRKQTNRIINQPNEQEKLIKELQNKNEEEMKLIQKLKKENEEQAALINELRSQNEEKNDLIKKQKNENEIQMNEILSLQKADGDKTKEITKLKDQYKKNYKICKNQNQQIVQFQNEISSLREENEKYHKKSCSNQRRTEKPEFFKILDSQTIQNLRIIREISSNSHGRILEVGMEENYALKEMNVDDYSVANHRHFMAEYEKIYQINHPNIIRTFGIFFSDEKNPPSIIFEYCPKNIEQEVNENNLSNVEIAEILYQIAEGMKYIHKQKLIHLNLKPSKILIGKNGLIRISDFFASEIMSLEISSSSPFEKNDGKFIAPEILNDEKYDEKADVYSFGVLMFFILSGGKFPDISISQIAGGIKTKIPTELTEFSKSLIFKCWDFDAKQRPSFEIICAELEKNIHEIVKLTDTEIKSAHSFIQNLKKKIPS